MKDCWKSIGIAGSIRGSGVTHLSVALANYAASGLGKKTAYLELHANGEIAHWKKAGAEGYFIDKKIHYYPKLKREQIPILLNCDYECVIMDFGDEYICFRKELLCCDKKVFLLNLNLWQNFYAKKLLDMIRKEEWGNIQPLYASANVQKKMKLDLENDYGIQIEKIPFIPDPVCIKSDIFACFDRILGHSAVKAKRKNLPIPIWKKK